MRARFPIRSSGASCSGHLSAFEVYRRVYRDVITPVRVAQLLILRDDMPRSLIRCCKEVYQNLKSVANEHSAETERRAGEMHAMLLFHAHGGHSRPPGCRSSSPRVSWEGSAIWATALRLISCYHRRRRKATCSCTFDMKRDTSYERPVKYSVQSLHLTPRRDPSQRALNWSISAHPAAGSEQVDAHGNISHLLTHRGATSGDPDRGTRGGRDRRHRGTPGRRAAVAARLPRRPPP